MKSVGEVAFSGCSGLSDLTISEGVAVIGDYAFERCQSLTSVTIPESVTLVGDGAFSACSRLTSITVPAGITVGKSAFGNHDPLARTDREDNPKDSDRSGTFFKRIFRRKRNS